MLMSSSTHSVQTALRALKKAATKGKSKKSLLENIDNIASSVVLLLNIVQNSSTPSPHAFTKLASVLRTPLALLYSNYTDTALNFSAAVLTMILNDGVRPCLLEGDERDANRQAGWENVANSLLSGVIDFLENEETEKSKTLIAKAFYSPVCNFFFLKDHALKTAVDATLRWTAYTLLSDTSAQHAANQAKLRDRKFLGGCSLGLVISRTRDYAVLEALLNLFARLLPSPSVSKQKHASFIRDVFSSNFTAYPNCGKKIVELLEGVATKDWEETATKLFGILSTSEISFPQPFDVNEVVVCEVKYPQPEVSDRFYIDRAAFFINVQQEDGMYESLLISYEDVQEITLVPDSGKTTLVTVNLSTAPKLGDQPLSTTSKSPRLQVKILNDDVSRFSEALCHRNLASTITIPQRTLPRKPRVSVTESSARLDFDEDGVDREQPPSPSLKVKEVQNFYGSEPVSLLQAESTNVHVSLIGLDATDDASKNESTCFSRPRDTNKKQKAKAQPSIETQLTDSVLGRSYEELTEIVDVVPHKVKAMRYEEKAYIAPAPISAGVVVLSDDDSEERTKSAARGKIDKDLRRCIVSDNEDEDATKDGVKAKRSSAAARGRPAESATTTKGAAASNSAKTASWLDGKPPADPPAEIKSSEVMVTGKNIVASGRPRRAAAATATAKLASAFLASEDAGSVNLSSVEPLCSSCEHTELPPTSAPVTETRTTAIKKTAQYAGRSQVVKSSLRISAPLEPLGPRSSSPTSKISRMKAKHPSAVTKFTTTTTKKRSSDHAFPSEDQNESRPSWKKSRTDVSNEGNDSEIDENLMDTPRPRDDVSTRSPQKHGHRERNLKAPAQQKAVVDWDQVPSGAPAQDSSSPKNNKHSSPVVTSKSLKVSKVSTTRMAKENVTIPDDETVSVMVDKKTKGRNQRRTRAPLQAVAHAPNTTSKEPPALVKTTKEKQIAQKPLDVMNAKPATGQLTKEEIKESVGPSLEDILLKGATLENAKDVESLEIDEEDVRGLNADVDNVDANLGLPDDSSFIPTLNVHGQARNDDEGGIAMASDEQFEPRTPLSSDKKTTVLSLPVWDNFKEKRPTMSKAADVEMIDLTKEDIKKLLHTLHTRGAEDGRTVTEAQRLRGTPSGGLAAVGSSPLVDEIAQEQHRTPSRPKVKFDVKPRYKSASFESLVSRELVVSRPPAEAGRKPPLSGGKPLPHVGSGEGQMRKKHDGHLRKEPGMEEIVNVLDAIQNVVVSNIANKSREVRSDIRAARDHLLYEAVATLHEMRLESVGHINNLFSLETEYANTNRKLDIGFKVVASVNDDICTFLRRSISTHDQGSLSKKMPQSLFDSALPQTFLKFI